VSFWTPVHTARLLRPQAEDWRGLGTLILLIKKRAAITLRYRTLVGKRESGRLRSSNSRSLSSLGISQWQTQKLLCAPAQNCLLMIVMVQGVQRRNPPGTGSFVQLPSALRASPLQAAAQQEHRRRFGHRLGRSSFSFMADCHIALRFWAKRSSPALIFKATGL